MKFELEKHDFFGGSIPIAWLDIGTNYLITEGGYPGGDEMPNLINVDEGSLLIIDKKAEFYNMWSKHLNRAMKVKANPRANSSSER